MSENRLCVMLYKIKWWHITRIMTSPFPATPHLYIIGQLCKIAGKSNGEIWPVSPPESHRNRKRSHEFISRISFNWSEWEIDRSVIKCTPPGLTPQPSSWCFRDPGLLWWWVDVLPLCHQHMIHLAISYFGAVEKHVNQLQEVTWNFRSCCVVC